MPRSAVQNHLGASACLFSGERGQELAGMLVEHFSNLKSTTDSDVVPLCESEAKRYALEAGIPEEDLDKLLQNTEFLRISNTIVEYFARPPRRVRTPTRDFANRHLSLQRGDRLLDAGCSAGRYLLEFADTDAELIGLDISLFAMEVGRRAWEKSQSKSMPEWHAGSVLDIPLGAGSCSHIMS